MSVVLLVRHGQASWGAENYDVLSEVGEQQATLAGRALAARGVTPDLVLHGAMVRQRRTAELLREASNWSCPVVQDPGWDEMNHTEVLSREPAPFEGRPPDRQEFQAWFEAATRRWVDGDPDANYTESFGQFGTRVTAALDAVVDRIGPQGTVVVATSGGPIAWATASLLGADGDVYARLAPVVVNSSITKIVVGNRGRTLVSFNEHAHLEGDHTALLTYR